MPASFRYHLCPRSNCLYNFSSCPLCGQKKNPKQHFEVLKVTVGLSRAVDSGAPFHGRDTTAEGIKQGGLSWAFCCCGKNTSTTASKRARILSVSASSCRYCTGVFTERRELIRRALTWGFYLEQKPLIALIKDLCDTPGSQNNNGGESKTREDGWEKRCNSSPCSVGSSRLTMEATSSAAETVSVS